MIVAFDSGSIERNSGLSLGNTLRLARAIARGSLASWTIFHLLLFTKNHGSFFQKRPVRPLVQPVRSLRRRMPPWDGQEPP